MQIKTVIGIPTRGSGPVGLSPKKKAQVSIDTERLSKLSYQLSELVEELDDIKEDLGEMMTEIENSPDYADYANGEEETPLDWIENIHATVDSAYQELNEALDEMEGLL